MVRAAQSALDRALAYARAGFSVMPIGREKTPAIKWTRLQQDIAGEDDLANWFTDGRQGIGIICGAVSGGLEVLDFDEHPEDGRIGRQVFREWISLVREHLPEALPRIAIVATPGGGYHCYCRCPDLDPIPGNHVLAHEPANHRAVIETRGEGGYVLAPGSPGHCHPTGKAYREVVKGGVGCQIATLPFLSLDEHEDLFALARSFDRPKPARARTGGASPRLDDGARPGDDFDLRGWDWEEILGPHGWTLAETHGEERRWRRPGKDRGWSATTGVCRGKRGEDLLRVFTSSVAGLDPDQAYGKFRAFAALNCDEDLCQAARLLRSQGFGQPGPGPEPARSPLATPERPPPGMEGLPRASWPEPPAREAFSGLAGEVVRVIDPETEADQVAILVQFLAFFGAAAGRFRYRSVGTRRHYPNLYAVLVGRTAKGRKGTSLDWIESLFRGADPEWADSCIQTGLSSGEGLISAVRDRRVKRRGEEEDEVIDEGVNDKRLLVVEEEFAGPLRLAARDGNILSAVLRQAWDGGRLRTMTKHSPLKATDAHVSIIGHITRDELLKTLRESEVANGFANRFLWVCCKRSKLLPDGGNPIDLSPLIDQVRIALSHARRSGGLTRDEEARQLWHAEYARLSSEHHGLYGLVTNRAEAQVLRLSVIYALLDLADTIEAHHLRAALALWDYCRRSCQWVYGTSTGNGMADDILAALLESPEGLTATEISRLFSRHRSARELGEALSLLVDQGQARRIQKATAGRPCITFISTRGCEKSEKRERS